MNNSSIKQAAESCPRVLRTYRLESLACLVSMAPLFSASRRDYQWMINPHPRKLSDRSVFTPYWAEPVTQNKNHNKAPSPPPPPPPVDCPPGPPAPLRATQTCRTQSLRSPWTWRCPGVTSSTQTWSPTRTSVNSVIASIAVWNFALTLWQIRWKGKGGKTKMPL